MGTVPCRGGSIRTSPPSELDLRQLSDALTKLKAEVQVSTPALGWLNTIRRSLGIRTAQLASRLGVSQPSVVRAEEREVTGAISLATLRRFASELDCDLVYYLVPRDSLTSMVERRAELVARSEAGAVAQSQGLEWQVVPPPSLVRHIERQKSQLVADRPTRLWDPVDGE